MMSAGLTPRAAAASASERTGPWRVTAYGSPAAATAASARASPSVIAGSRFSGGMEWNLVWGG